MCVSRRKYSRSMGLRMHQVLSGYEARTRARQTIEYVQNAHICSAASIYARAPRVYMENVSFIASNLPSDIQSECRSNTINLNPSKLPATSLPLACARNTGRNVQIFQRRIIHTLRATSREMRESSRKRLRSTGVDPHGRS